MAFSFYLCALALSTAVTARFAQDILTDYGYGPTFGLSVMLALGFAALYLFAQLAYMAFVRLYKPTAAASFYGAECFSLLSAAVLLPPVLDIAIPWPDLALVRFEPLLLLAAFLGAHGIFKLISFFAAVSGAPAPRWPWLVWGGVAALCALTALGVGQRWREGLETARPKVDAVYEPVTLAGATMGGNVMHEGAVMEADLPEMAGGPPTLIFRWAPAATGEAPPPASLYLHITLEGDTRTRFEHQVRLDNEGWIHVKAPREQVPANLTRCRIYWSAERLPRWQRMLPVRPVITSARAVYVGQPGVYPARETAAQRPNVIVLFVDAFGARHMSGLGYGRRTTPGMDQLGRSGWLFRNAYTPAAESVGAAASMLTGVTPLHHGHFAGRRGPLPDGVTAAPMLFQQAQYATALFSEDEGAGQDEWLAGGGLEHGFEYVDAGYVEPPEPEEEASDEAESSPAPPSGPVGSDRTLVALRDWIEAHEAAPFFVAARLTALARADEPGAPHAPIFLPETGAPRPADHYDSALRHLDGGIQELMRDLRRMQLAAETRVIIAGTYGADFTPAGDGAEPGLTEEGLRTPLVIHNPAADRNEVTGRVSTVELFPTLLELADLEPVEAVAGDPLTREDAHWEEVMSVQGLPLAVSLRTQDWRFNLETDWNFFETPRPEDAEGSVILYGGATRGADRWVRNRSPQNPRTTQRFREQILALLQEQAETMPAWREMDGPN